MRNWPPGRIPPLGRRGSLRIRFWGVRGSIAAPGFDTAEFGGNTACIQVTAPTGEILILDAGTGIRPLGQKIIADGGPKKMALLISHTHWDHIQGFPYFIPIYMGDYTIDLFGPKLPNRSMEEIFSVFLDYEFHPVRSVELSARIQYHDLVEETFRYGPFTVRTRYAHHPVVALSYRIDCAGKTLVYTGDHEPHFHQPGVAGASHTPEHAESQNSRYLEFLRGADAIVSDAMYTREEYERKRLWGHTSIDDAVEMAAKAGIRRVCLFHHEPNYGDTMLKKLEAEHLPELKRRLKVPDLVAEFAREGRELDV